MANGVVKPFPVEKEYEKNPDIKPEDIQSLREWVERQPHLPAATLTDLDLMLVFHCCDRSALVSKQVLDLHYTLRTLFTAYFLNREVDQRLEHTCHTTLIAPLSTPTVNDYRAIYCRLLDPDPRNFIFADVLRAFMMVFDLWQLEEGTWPGFVLVIDMDKAVVGHLARLDLMTIRQLLYFLQEAMLVRLREVHFLNAPSFMDKLMLMLKPFMKKAMLDMIRIHQIGADSVYKYIPKEAFPKESGGEYKDYNTLRDETWERLKKNKQYIKDENRNRVNEALRPGKPKTIDTLFGIEGSFKKLDID